MKKNIKYFAIALILLCCLMGAASAADDVSADVVDASADAVAVDAVSEDVSDSLESTVVEDEPVVVDSASAQDEIDDVELEASVDDDYALDDGDDEVSEESQEYVIWVGPNQNDGDGSESNPFASLELACNDISEGKNNVIINVLEGTYYIGADLTFNCSNLHIKGLSSDVVFKNLYPDKQHDGKINSQESLDLIDNQGNFTMSNIVIDTSTKTYNNNWYRGQYFLICKGTPKTVTFDNCTFLNFCNPINTEEEYRNRTYLFNKCEFRVTSDGSSKVSNMMTGIIVNNATLKNCIFYWERPRAFTGQPVSEVPGSIAPLFEDCWLGINSIPNTFYGSLGEDMGYIINRYAIFNISENYLGNDIYEVTGKLVWNDSTTDGFENFNPMVVSLSSSTGNIPNTAILENGTFKVRYTSTESNHKITATLDNEVQSLEFQSINLSLDAPIIDYGDNQNITVTLPEEYNGVIYVTVNGKTYEKTLELNNVVTIDIPDVLPSGTYDVNVTFIDKVDNENCAIYGFNTTTITVNQVSGYDFDVTVPEITAGEASTTTIKLPEDATGNITVTIDGEVSSVVNLTNGIATITIPELSAGNHEVVIAYSGDGKYGGFSQSSSVTVKEPVTPTKLTAAKVTATYNVAKKLVITLTANGKALANKKVTVKVGTISKTLTTNAKGQISLNVATLVPKAYTATVKFAGDSSYSASTVSPKVVVKKAKVKLAAKAKTFKVKVKTKKYIVTLKNNKGKVMKKVKLTLKVGKKTYKATTNAKGKATFKITKLTKKGKYSATVKFAGSKYYNKLSKKVKITVKK